jgi:hypothetical protein
MIKRFKLIVLVLVLVAMVFPVGNVGVTTVSAGGYCDWAQFVADVTVPDGVPVAPAQALKKTWRLKNIGTCTWTKAYKLVFVSGEQMGGVAAMNLPIGVEPGQTIDLSVALTAPIAIGKYYGYWGLQNPSGGVFGFGSTANKSFWVAVNVVDKATPSYSFVAQAPFARWGTEAYGVLRFPGFYGDPKGFAITYDRPILENGAPSSAPGILMAPPADFNEFIYGIFPVYQVKKGDYFQTIIGCEYGSKDCDVTYVLQYQIEGTTTTRTFWNKRKIYKNSFEYVNLKLTGMDGKKVVFTLLVRPNGVSTTDRALWVNPVIVNMLDPVPPSAPTVTPVAVTPVPTISTLPPYTGCNRATFVSDITVPDGTVLLPGQPFTKTWRFRNTGKCTWTTDYSLAFSAGDQMGGPSPVKLPSVVAPNQTVDISLNLTAPTAAGNYRGYWLMMNDKGGMFGIGTLADKPFWLSVNVAGTQPSSSGSYDFVSHVCEAQWTSGAGVLPCQDLSELNGSISVVNNPRLENNTVDSRPALLTVPQNAYNGYIQGIYPPFTVQRGDRFKSIVNCEYGQRSCYTVYRLDYQVDTGPVKNLWAFGERYDGLYYQADIDLSSLAGQNVKFILKVSANGSPEGDRAMWVAPSIVRSEVVVPPTSTPTVTLAATTPAPTRTSAPTPVGPTLTATFTATVPPVDAGQLSYLNQRYGFQFTYPKTGAITVSQDNFIHMNLPVSSGTNLGEKYLDLAIFENASSCTSPLTSGYAPGSFTSQPVTINGIQFVKESGQGAGAGQIYDWVAYSTIKGTACISMSFVLHSTNPSNYPVPPPVYNKEAESAVFTDITSTFNWTP